MCDIWGISSQWCVGWGGREGAGTRTLRPSSNPPMLTVCAPTNSTVIPRLLAPARSIPFPLSMSKHSQNTHTHTHTHTHKLHTHTHTHARTHTHADANPKKNRTCPVRSSRTCGPRSSVESHETSSWTSSSCRAGTQTLRSARTRGRFWTCWLSLRAGWRDGGAAASCEEFDYMVESAILAVQLL